ncbi:MAG: RibD family protein [Deltaproteobacteria bacterium]|nr:RibD family protein [Deltaproteobacteria bacterium]
MKVVLVGAVTICGRISPAGFGSLLDRRRLEQIRDSTGASIMGANTLRTENPEMRGSNGTLRPDRVRSIISGSGNISANRKKLFRHGPKPVVFSGEKNKATLRDKFNNKAEVVSLPNGPHGLSLQAVLDFFADRGVNSLLVEGGAQLNYTALAEGIVDEIFLTILPYVSGARNETTFADGPKGLGDPFMKLELLSSEPVSTGELFLHYRLEKIK